MRLVFHSVENLEIVNGRTACPFRMYYVERELSWSEYFIVRDSGEATLTANYPVAGAMFLRTGAD